MDEENKKYLSIDPHLQAATIHLLEALGDKDENFKYTIETSLMKISEKQQNEILLILCDYRLKHPKLNEYIIATILRIIENITTLETTKLTNPTIKKLIELSIVELIKTQDHCIPIQKPSLEILVSIGRHNCTEVMDELMEVIQKNQNPHFMILHCMGTLATANVKAMINYIKPIFSQILPNLGSIKQDHVKQAYSFAIGRFCEAIIEYFTHETITTDNLKEDNFGTEISIAYEVLLHQWLPSREPKVCCEILYSLSLMFPLLPSEKIIEQIPKVVPSLLNLYRRSIDRIAITQLLASILKSIIKIDSKKLDPFSDQIINNLFDLVCVSPDYEKPQTAKGHFEVLRCFDLLAEIYHNKILDLILIQLRSNNERERIKSLHLLTHLTNTCCNRVSFKIKDFIVIIKAMLQLEKPIKLKMVILRTIVAFAQKGFIDDPEIIKFIIRHCCQYNKISLENGTIEEYSGFVEACNNSMFILSTTVGTIDDLLKRELLKYFILLDYTDACSTIAKCLGNLFIKNGDLIEEKVESTEGDDIITNLNPSPESIFIRSLILLGNFNERKRILNILGFLKSYCKNLNKHLVPLWNEKIPEIINSMDNENLYNEKIYDFLISTIRDIDEPKFAELLANKLTDQISLYIPNQNNQINEFKIPILIAERGMMLKLLGIILSYISDSQTVEAKIDVILNTAKLEKLEKNIPNSGFEYRLSDAAKSLGFISKTHSKILLQKLENFINDEGTKKGSGNFFSGLNFIKDAQKDIDIYKVKLLATESFGYVIQHAPKPVILETIDQHMIKYLLQQLIESRDFILRKTTIQTLLNITEEIIKTNDSCFEFQSRDEILKLITKLPVEAFHENIQLFPNILKLATFLIKIPISTYEDMSEYLHTFCRNFFTSAQQLKTKFDSQEEDERNSILAKYLNQALPELNLFIRAMLEQNPSPACLDDINSILEIWLKDKNNEVRICAGHIFNNSLDIYIKTMKIGCEAPSKFNQTGSMIAKIVPRCIDSNATVRQTSIDILRKILEISCIYDTLTIADDTRDWIITLNKIHEEIITDDPREIYKFAGDIAKVIGDRLSNFQYLQFCKSLLYSLNDPEQSSSIGASVVLKFFIQNKGSELFHALPELVKESLHVIKFCENNRAKSGVLKALIGLTKHHPKGVCAEILNQNLPYEAHIVEYWHMLSLDLDLAGVIIDNFLTILNSSCLYEQQDDTKDNRQKVATFQPFAIICAFKEMFLVQEIAPELKIRFAEIFSLLLTTLATYTNLIAPIISNSNSGNGKKVGGSQKGNSKFSLIPNRDLVKISPCQIVLETFITFLGRLEMEQVSVALTASSDLSACQDLGIFIDILSPLATGLANQLSISSTSMKDVVKSLNKYISSPYDPQRIAAIGFFSQLIPLQPFGEISSVLILHLQSSLNDPNPLVRGLCIRGLAFVGNLTDHDIDKYTESSLSSLLKGIDDYNGDCLINIPLESMRGLSRTLKSIKSDKLDMFQVSMSIRIRPFIENNLLEIREAAICLFGDLCETKFNDRDKISDVLLEQIFSNIISILLHLSETDQRIVRACKITLRSMCALLNVPSIITYTQNNLNEHDQLNYDTFLIEFTKLIGKEFPNKSFIESTLPYLKSYWEEIRGNAAIVIGILSHFDMENHQQLDISNKIEILLKDEKISVKIKASKSIGYLFGDL